MREILPGLFHWTAKHPRIGIEVSSHWLAGPRVLIDPLAPPDGVEPAAILLSNRHHYRGAGDLTAPVYASRPGMHEFGDEQEVIPFDFGDELPGGVRAVEVGGICADDTALYLPEQRAVLFADAIVDGGPHGTDPVLGFVPDRLMNDAEEDKPVILASLQRILDELDFDHVLLAHGQPRIDDGRAQLQRLVDEGGRTAF